MKKRIRKLSLIACAAVCTVMISACGSPKSTSKQTDDAKQAETTEKNSSQDSSASTEKFASIQEFVDSDIMKKELASQADALKDSGMAVKILGEDNKLVYNFTLEDPELSKALDAEALNKLLDSQASSFESVAGVLPSAIEIDNPVVLVRYLSKDGTEITSREFSPSDSSSQDTSGGTTEQ